MSQQWEIETEQTTRRNSLQIWFEILEQSRRPINKTRIVYSCNLNFKIARIHLNKLIEKNLIEQRENLFKTTNKGLEWIMRFKAVDF